MNYGGRVYRNRAFNYIGTRKRCGACAKGNASRSCCPVHSAVRWAVTLQW